MNNDVHTNQYDGKILVCIWGATMRMVDFYKVTKETERGVKVRKLKQSETPSDTEYLAGYSMPTMAHDDIDLYQLKRVATDSQEELYTGYLTKGGFKRYFRVWDGRPVYYNHCD